MISRLRSTLALCSCLFAFSCGVLAAEEPPEEPTPDYCRIKEKYGEIFVHPENLSEWAEVLTTDAPPRSRSRRARVPPFRQVRAAV